MTVNWFEGGRRISKLLILMIVAAGAVAMYEAYDSTPTIANRGPTMPWFVADEPCEYPSYRRSLPAYPWGGEKPGLSLCFLALDNDKIPYAVAPTPTEEKAKEEAEDRVRKARNEPPVLRLRAPWFYTDEPYSSPVLGYIEKTASELRIEPDLKAQLSSTHWGWRAFKRVWGQVAPWVFGLCFGIWFATAVIGWIVRGFAGVPSGQDFRQEAR